MDTFNLKPSVSEKSMLFVSAGGGWRNIQGGGGYVLPITQHSISVQAFASAIYNYREKGGGVGFGAIVKGQILEDSLGIPVDLAWFSFADFNALSIKVVLEAGGGLSVGKTLHTPDATIAVGVYAAGGAILRYRNEWYISDQDLDPDAYGAIGMMFRKYLSPYHFTMEVRFTEAVMFLFNWYFSSSSPDKESVTNQAGKEAQ